MSYKPSACLRIRTHELQTQCVPVRVRTDEAPLLPGFRTARSTTCVDDTGSTHDTNEAVRIHTP